MLMSACCRAFLSRLRCLSFAGIRTGLFLGLICEAAAASDYFIDVKDEKLPSSIVTAIAQTPDDYLWVGTYNGLSRFDGERFVTFDPVNTPEISRARIQGLYVDVA